MKNLLLIISLVSLNLMGFAQTDLFISEYVEGTGNNKGVEIYNPTAQTIDLSSYYIIRFSNGSGVFTEGGATKLIGNLAPYKTHVLVNGQTTSTGTSPACSPEMQALADQLDGDYPAPMYMNGNDAIALIKTPNGEAPNANMSNVTSVDLIGQIGMGSQISAETGWSYVKDSTLTYNDANGDPITGKVINYIVQKRATDGTNFGPFWMSWTSDHSLIRKPTVVTGVVVNANPFIVNMEWDTVPAKLDPETGFYSYKDIWDNLGKHACVADPNYTSVKENSELGSLSIYPNPVVADRLTLSADKLMKSATIYTITGKAVFSNDFNVPAKSENLIIGDLKPGLYLVKVEFTNNSSTTQKVIIE